MPMHQVYFRFYAELNELLPPTKRGSCFAHGLDPAASLKDVIEALGVLRTQPSGLTAKRTLKSRGVLADLHTIRGCPSQPMIDGSRILAIGSESGQSAQTL
jgi:hypothetical protein